MHPLRFTAQCWIPSICCRQYIALLFQHQTLWCWSPKYELYGRTGGAQTRMLALLPPLSFLPHAPVLTTPGNDSRRSLAAWLQINHWLVTISRKLVNSNDNLSLYTYTRCQRPNSLLLLLLAFKFSCALKARPYRPLCP